MSSHALPRIRARRRRRPPGLRRLIVYTLIDVALTLASIASMVLSRDNPARLATNLLLAGVFALDVHADISALTDPDGIRSLHRHRRRHRNLRRTLLILAIGAWIAWVLTG